MSSFFNIFLSFCFWFFYLVILLGVVSMEVKALKGGGGYILVWISLAVLCNLLIFKKDKFYYRKRRMQKLGLGYPN